MLSKDYILAIEQVLVFEKKYFFNSEYRLKHPNDYDLLDKKHTELSKSVLLFFREWLNQKELGSLENKFIQSFHYVHRYSFETVFHHLQLLIGYQENNDINFQSYEYDLEFMRFYQYLVATDNYYFWLIARLINLVEDHYIGKIILKNIYKYRQEYGEDYFQDGTSLEYLKMYIHQLKGDDSHYEITEPFDQITHLRL